MSTSGYVPVPNGRLYHEVDGEGPALLLIHAGVAHLRQWDEQVPAFAAAHRVIRFDTRGFGRTESESGSFSNRADVIALLDQLGVERAHVVGNSRGGTIALDTALEHPARVASLVLVGSTPSGFDYEDPTMDDFWEELERAEEAREWERVVEMEVALWCDGYGQSPDRVDPSVRERMLTWGRENYAVDRGDLKPIPLAPPATGRLGEVRVPTLVVWGDLDEGGVLAGSRDLSLGIAGARSHVFPGVAHMVNLERPAEFTSLVLDHLAVGAPRADP